MALARQICNSGFPAGAGFAAGPGFFPLSEKKLDNGAKNHYTDSGMRE